MPMLTAVKEVGWQSVGAMKWVQGGGPGGCMGQITLNWSTGRCLGCFWPKWTWCLKSEIKVMTLLQPLSISSLLRHWLTDAYILFATPYFAYDIYAMFLCYRHKLQVKGHEEAGQSVGLMGATVIGYLRREFLMVLHHIFMVTFCFPASLVTMTTANIDSDTSTLIIDCTQRWTLLHLFSGRLMNRSLWEN